MNKQATCIICKFCDLSEYIDYKYYCEWLCTFEYPDKAKDCPCFSNSDIP